ncbi:MAG: DUF5305 family protein [Thermoproteota archaeon]
MFKHLGPKKKSLLVVLVFLLAFSGYLIYSFHQKPLTITEYVEDGEYLQEVDYDYTAYIHPSVLYENQTILPPGEKVYPSLVHSLNISLIYNFSSTPPAEDLEVTYNVSAILESKDKWTKKFTLTPTHTQQSTHIKETYHLDVGQIEDWIQTIEQETETRSSAYYYRIKPHIQVDATLAETSITEKYIPTLNIKWGSRVLDFSGLSHQNSDSIGEYRTSQVTYTFTGLAIPIVNLRYFSYALFALIFLGLAFFVWQSWQQKPRPEYIDTLPEEYREKIIEAQEPISEQLKKTTLRVESLEDLAKVSQETFKPIIYETVVKEGEGKRHTFYVLDADIKYELTVNEPQE